MGRDDREQDGNHVVGMVQVRGDLVAARNWHLTRRVARRVASGISVTAFHADDRPRGVELEHYGVDVLGCLLGREDVEGNHLGGVEDAAVDGRRRHIGGLVGEVHDRHELVVPF